MKITPENIKNLNISENDKNLLDALLIDLAELNNMTSEDKHFYIDYQDWHNEYSPEWTDPCPDYYGYYTLRFEQKSDEMMGVEMDLDTLDTVMCTLYNYVEFMQN